MINLAKKNNGLQVGSIVPPQIGSIVTVRKPLPDYDEEITRIRSGVTGVVVNLENDATIVLFDGQPDIVDVEPANIVLVDDDYSIEPNAFKKAQIRLALYHNDYFDVVRKAIAFAGAANSSEEVEDQLSYAEFKNLLLESLDKTDTANNARTKRDAEADEEFKNRK
jgi:hypothetical protein